MHPNESFANCLAPLLELPAADILAMIETPPNPEMGDAALPCFPFARTLRKAPPAIAAQLAEQIGEVPGIARIEVVGGYLNAFWDPAAFVADVLEQVATGSFGTSTEGEGKTIVMDYSSINIAKRFHIGHLSTTLIGSVLSRVYRQLGYTTARVNHLGDWGTQFGKMIAAFLRWGDEARLAERGIEELTELYQRFYQEEQTDEALAAEGREWFRRMEEGDSQALDIFNRFKEMTLRDAEKIYEKLNVQFDSYAGESFYSDKMQPVIDHLRNKGLLVQSEGAWVVDLEAEKMPPCLILKSDGATLYTTRDLAAALYRANTYHADRILYIVAYHQDLHFRQWFTVAKKAGWDWADNLEHVAYGMVSYEGQALSTRKGTMVLLEEVLERAVQKAADVLDEKNPNLQDKANVARQVGIGAVIVSTLLNNRIKDIDFTWDRALNFDGETGPYLQYTAVRCQSLLRKGSFVPGDANVFDANELTDALAFAAAKQLSLYPDILREVIARNEPYLLTRYLLGLAQAFNAFYYANRILDAAPAARVARLALANAVLSVLTDGLGLLGVEVPDAM